MDSMIENVARALYEREPAMVMLPGSEPYAIPWEQIPDDQAPYFATARAVMETMREPTPGMLEAAKPYPRHLESQASWTADDTAAMKRATVVDQMVARSDWQAMIDAAIANAQGGEGR